MHNWEEKSRKTTKEMAREHKGRDGYKKHTMRWAWRMTEWNGDV